MAKERIPERSSPSDFRRRRVRGPAVLDNQLQPDPELAEGPASNGRIAIFAVAIAVVLGVGVLRPEQFVDQSRRHRADGPECSSGFTSAEQCAAAPDDCPDFAASDLSGRRHSASQRNPRRNHRRQPGCAGEPEPRQQSNNGPCQQVDFQTDCPNGKSPGSVRGCFPTFAASAGVSAEQFVQFAAGWPGRVR